MIIEIKLNGAQLHVFNTSKTEVILGRGKEADFSIDAEEVSRIHCEIKENNGKYYVQDLKSANGTFVYDEKIPPNQFCEFLTEFPLRLGKTVQVLIHKVEPVSEVDEYGSSKKRRTNPNSETRIFSGIVKKDLLKANKVEKKPPYFVLLPLLVIGLGVGYYFWHGSQPSESPTQTIPAVQAPVVEEVKLPFPASGCFYDDEKALCQAMLLPEGDYIALVDGELSMVVNLARIVEREAADVSTLPEEVRTRFILIQLLNQLHESTSSMSFPTELTKLVLYGVTDDYKQQSLKLELDLATAPKHEDVKAALESALASGSMTEFETQFGQFYKVQ